MAKKPAKIVNVEVIITSAHVSPTITLGSGNLGPKNSSYLYNAVRIRCLLIIKASRQARNDNERIFGRI